MMKNKLHLLIAFAAFALAAPCAAQTQSTCSPEQRKQFTLTAVGKDGAIEKLRAEQLSLKVGASPATIDELAFRTSQPLDLAILIDASASQELVIPTYKAAARAFIKSVPIAGRDRVAIVSFAEKPNQIQALTSDLAAAAAATEQVKFEPPPGYVGGGVIMTTNPHKSTGGVTGSTSLWDSVRTATGDLFGDADKSRRRVVILFSDGTDTSSSSKLNPAIDEVIKRDVVVFSIGMVADNKLFIIDEGPLKRLSERTGGVAKFPRNHREKLDEALTEVARHLRGNYVVGYCGGAASDRAKLQVEVVDPEIRKAKPALAYKRY